MLNIAHRGASAYAPENTRAAFDLAIEMGADMIETDIQLTSDGVAVLMHDPLVDRTSDGHGPIADQTLAELSALDLGGWFDARFAGERIVTLDEFIATYIPRIPAALEIKEAGAAAATADAVLAAGIADRVHVTSFHWPALIAAQAIAPDLTYGFLTPVFNADIIARSARRGFRQICPHVDALTTALVNEAHAADLVVRAWGVRERAQIDHLRDTGGDGATVNWPDWLTN